MTVASLATSLVWAAAVGSGLLAGVFFAFSTFVMPALSRVNAPVGLAAMREINVAVYPSAFMLMFAAVSVTAVLLAGFSIWRWSEPGSALVLAGAAIYLLGGFAVTAAFNVPLNVTLAAMGPAEPQIMQFWPRYVAEWTLWNHLRTAACTAAMLCFILALIRGGA